MTHERFAALVARLEESARLHPAAYRLRVIALALGGYAYLGLVIALLVALLALAIVSISYIKVWGVKLAIAIAILLWAVLKSFWIVFPAPGGIAISRREAPALFAMIDRLRSRLRSKRFHHVLITNDFNASVVQRPRLGAFGWHANYLCIGLPLMKSLTPGQLEAVLAHEFGHLAGGHGRLSNWIYRLRLTWYRLLAALQQRESLGLLLFKPFFLRYAPYFEAYSFPLARANEYEADAAAARLASPRAVAEALTRVEVIARYLDEQFWPEVHRQADDVPQPAFAPFSAMGERLSRQIDETRAHGWLEVAMARETTIDDTHPSLSDRLKSLGEAPRNVAPAPGAAADALLGAALGRITHEFDASWKAAIAESWERRHRAVREGRTRLAQLDAQASGAAQLSVDEAFERAVLTEQFGAGDDDALDQFRRLHERAPDHVPLLLNLGRRLLDRDDEAGRPLVERAIELERAALMPGCEAIRNYLWRKGRKDEARAWHARLAEAAQKEELARQERSDLKFRSRLEPHGLPREAIEALQARLRTVARLRKVYLARKHLEHFPERPLLVMGFTVTPWWRWTDRRTAAEVQRALLTGVALPHEAIVFCLEGSNAAFAKKFRRIGGSRLL